MPKEYKARSPHPAPGASLPGSVEQSYRQKCKEIKKRIHEIESSNGLLTARIQRARRAIQRMRLERAFLLQQLETRTEDHVSDSEGSPSPPPTPGLKPLRMKRARKDTGMAAESPPTTAAAGAAPGGSEDAAGGGAHNSSSNNNTNNNSTFIGYNLPAASAKKAGNAGHGAGSKRGNSANGPKKPQNAYMIFCERERENLLARESGNPGFELPKALAQAWRELKGNGQKEYFDEYDKNLQQWRRMDGAQHHHNHHHSRSGRAVSTASSNPAAPASVCDGTAPGQSPNVGSAAAGSVDEDADGMEE